MYDLIHALNILYKQHDPLKHLKEFIFKYNQTIQEDIEHIWYFEDIFEHILY